MLRNVAAALLVMLAARIAHADVTTDHPRIYVGLGELPALRAELPVDPDFILMQEWMDRRIQYQDAAPMVAGSYPTIIMTDAAFVAMVLPDDDAYANEARIYLATLAGFVPDAENDVFVTRNRLLALAIGYDWLYDVLSPAERTATRDAIFAFTTSLQGLLDEPNFVAGASRWANVVSLAGALSIANDDPRLDATLDVVLANWREGYNPVLEVVGDGGGHHMAWMYGPAYSGFEAPLMWRTAWTEDEPWVADFLADSAYFPIYGANGAYRLPPIEDCFADTIYPGTLGQMALSSSIYANPHAEAFYQELGAAFVDPPLSQPPDLWLRLVTRADAPEPAPIDELPLTRLFPGSGFLVTRDTWSRPDATTIVFKASPFYSIGHHQRDEGSIFIDYRGPLLVDAGQYDGSGSDDHYRNFYSRSVAHNTLLVQWPEEDDPLNGFVPDGGQEVRFSQAHDTIGIAGEFALDGIVGHSDADACVWARSDTADTYNTEKLTTYTRDVLEIRRPDGATHPAVLVLDRATLPEARTSSLLWHFAANAEVDVENGRITAQGADQSALHPALSGGRIRLDLLRPAAPSIVSFSGDERWTVNGVAHPPAVDDLLSPYWGRVQVSPAAPELAPVWSTLIRVGDAELEAETLAPIDIAGDDWIGARLGDTIFAIAAPTTSTITLPDGAPLVDGCIAGLEADAFIDVVVGDGDAVQVQANADGVAVYDPSEGGDSSTGATGDGTGDPSEGGSATADVTGDPTSTMTGLTGATGDDTSGVAIDDVSGDSDCSCTTSPRGRWLAIAWPMLVLLARRRRYPGGGCTGATSPGIGSSTSP